MELFIKDLRIDNIRNIQDFTIPLSDTKRKHLILTGKNGSGKTSTLLEINNLLTKLFNNQFKTLDSYHNNIKSFENAKKQQLQQINQSKASIQQANEQIVEFQNQIEKTTTTDPINRARTQQQLQQQITNQRNNIINFQQNISNCQINVNSYDNNIKQQLAQIANFSKININFVNQEHIYQSLQDGSFIMTFFQATRQNKPTPPNGVQKLNIQKKNATQTTLSTHFIQYLVNLRMEMLDSMAENEDEEVKKINDWFNNLENSLKELFDQNDLKLKYKKKEFNYKIEYGNSSFGLNELSDGYSAVLSIITELILRMEVHNMGTYDLQGVVLIDELETHLHVGLQKKILPFLSKFFPKIQFIVTTHSPFILSSLKDVVICDLEKKIIIEDLSAYSYESLVDSYFDLDKYSIKIQNDIQIYRELKQKYLNKNLSEDEQIQFVELEIYLENIPKYNNEEIGLSIKEIKEMV